MKYSILLLLLMAGCGSSFQMPEQQCDMIRRCEFNGLDWTIGDWGVVYCKKKELK